MVFSEKNLKKLAKTISSVFDDDKREERIYHVLNRFVLDRIKKHGFSQALEILQDNKIVKRKKVKNDTVIINYKNQLYQMSQSTGVRYPYVPTNADLMANDWVQVIQKSIRGNILVDQTYKDSEDSIPKKRLIMTKEDIKQKVSVIISNETIDASEKRNQILSLFDVNN